MRTGEGQKIFAAGLSLLETENREGGVLVAAGDGEVPGWAGKTGTCTGTSIPGHRDEGEGPWRCHVV